MRKMLFIFAAVLLSSIGLHAGNTITYKASAQLPGTTLSVGAYTFGPAITSHTFSNGTGTITCEGEITQIGISAFSNCRSLTSIDIPNSVTTIDINAFLNCTSLTSIEIPSSVKAMTFNVFYGCTGLISVIVNWTDAQSIIPLDRSAFEEIANGAGPAGAMLYVPMGTADLYQQADGWKDFGSIAISIPRNTITYTASERLPGYNYSLEIGAITFGPAITSHTFSNGTGTITCSGEITWIGMHAFENCMSLSSITIPNSVIEIDYSAFEDCSKLTSITIPNSVTTIAIRAFFGAGLTSITIPNSVTEIGYSAFWGCRDLKSVTISNSVTTIAEQTFNRCSSLTLVNIPNSVTTIKNMAFRACTSLTSIVIPASVKQIEWGTFMESSNLQSVYCYALTPPSRVGGTIFTNQPTVYTFNTGAYIESWSELPASCFKPMPPVVVGDLKYEFFDGNKARVVAKEGGYTGNIVIPNQITYQGMNFAVTEIGMDAFWQCSNLSSVTIPNSVTTIGQSAFFETGLTSVTIPASVKEIGTWAFKNCTQLKDLQFAERTDAIKIGTYAFENMALEEVVIPDWMINIPEGMFYNNQKLETIYLHEGIDSIGYRPFGLCPFKYIISMSQTPPALAEGAFEGHNKDADVIVYLLSNDAVVAYQNSDWSKYFTTFVTNVNYRITSSSTAELTYVIPEEKIITIPTMVAISGSFYQVTGIGEEAFKDNTMLESVSLPPSIQYIGNDAFSGCTQLKQTNSRFWEDLQTIGDRAFYGCSALDSIVIPEGVQSIGNGAFMECQNLVHLSLLTGLKIIPNDCFRHCYNLRDELIIPEGVDTIGVYAFNTDTALKKVYLPSTLKELRYGAFAGTALREVICLAPTPPTLVGATFGTKDSALSVYLPNRDIISIYKNSQWGGRGTGFTGCWLEFFDLMAEENKQYLYLVAGDNEEAKAIASAYCDSIDNYANNSEDVQQYTNTALGKIDKITLAAYKQNLIDSLANYAKSKGENIQAQQIAEQYAPQIRNAYFRQDAEQLFTEAMKKITDIFELIALKENYITLLRKQAGNDPDLQKVAADYGALIQLAETKDEAYDLYTRAQMRIEANKKIKEDWKGGSSKVGDRTCITTKGYIDNH
ncbi:MAG: leucine-rich repeat domain-containing protein [Paludibacteraceae bacterium]|nr:leucine-rich repeat domain-containing protein [Paludibacteraceae bacterium]